MAELRNCDFDFSRLSNQLASRDAELPTGELVANLRSDVMHHWTPPRGGYHGALNHVVIHGAMSECWGSKTSSAWPQRRPGVRQPTTHGVDLLDPARPAVYQVRHYAHARRAEGSP